MTREQQARVNRGIRASQVRLVDENGQQVGIVSLEEALARANDVGLDLVEVAPNAKPPVCRLMDYGKYRYEQSKKAQEAKKRQTVIQVKEVKMRPRTDVHDMNVKKKKIVKFLNQGNKVKVTVQFRGREIVHPELGAEMLKKIAEEMSDISVVEHMPNMEGRTLTMVLAPKKAR
ncbi:MAG: translation initiation factor IF-3 [Thermodesulfobacteria bacterium]|nr:translation initiation factor IF-3 [Thermodesulfobacteriota bacterium]